MSMIQTSGHVVTLETGTRIVLIPKKKLHLECKLKILSWMTFRCFIKIKNERKKENPLITMTVNSPPSPALRKVTATTWQQYIAVTTYHKTVTANPRFTAWIPVVCVICFCFFKLSSVCKKIATISCWNYLYS